MSTKGGELKKIIFPSGVPKLSAVPYSPGVQVGNTVYLSGCIGIDLNTGSLVSADFEPQCKQVMLNLGLVLTEAKLSFKDVVKTTVLLADMNDFAALNRIYTEVFTSNYPARTTYQVAHLPFGARVEIEAIAVVGCGADPVVATDAVPNTTASDSKL